MPMTRSVALLGSVLALFVAGTASGVIAGDYAGNVNGDEGALVTFQVKKTDNAKRVKSFITDDVDFTCTVGTPGETVTMQILASFPVEDQRFKGSGEAVGIPADPFGKVTGKFKPGGRAVGTLKLRGELDGEVGSHCTTGVVGWRAERTGF
jgi:hypothetical protein